MNLGRRIRKLRTYKELTQEELGKLLNKTKNNISQYETDKRSPDPETIRQLADIFNCSVDYLFGRTDDPTPPRAKRQEPTHEEYILDVRTLADAAIRIANLFNEDLIDEDEYLRLNRLAVKKFPLRPTKGSPAAAHLVVNVPCTGVFEKKKDR